MRGGLCHYPSGVQEMFPQDKDLVEQGVESYLGVPLVDGADNVLGHLAVFHGRPMPAEPRLLFIFRIFAMRAAVELERLRVEKQLVESERRYRDLYEEAPNAYVSVGRDLRLINVNRRATQLLGYSAAEMVGSHISAYFAQTTSSRAKDRASLCRRIRRRGDLRPGAGNASSRRQPALGQRLDATDARGRWRYQSRPLDLGRCHGPGAGRRRASAAS